MFTGSNNYSAYRVSNTCSGGVHLFLPRRVKLTDFKVNATRKANKPPWNKSPLTRPISLQQVQVVDWQRKCSEYSLCLQVLSSLAKMGLVCITSWYPKFNGSHFGLPPRSIHRMTGLGGKMVWRYAHRPHSLTGRCFQKRRKKKNVQKYSLTPSQGCPHAHRTGVVCSQVTCVEKTLAS